MTTPANLTFSQITTRVMNQLRIPVTNATEGAKIQAMLNEVYRDICAKRDWSWLVKRTVINTRPKYTAGTISVTNQTTAVVLSSSPGALNFVGGELIIPGASQDALAVYRVANHVGTAITLDALFTDATNTAAGFRLYFDSYPLPDDTNKVLNVKRYGELLPMERVGIEEMSAIKLSDQTEGPPEVYSVFDFCTPGDPTTAKMLQIHPYPDTNAHRLEIFYKQSANTELSGSTRPFIPDDFAQVLIYGLLAQGYPVWLNDIERGSFYQQKYEQTLALMALQNKEYAHDNAGVRPDMSGYRTRRTRRVSTMTTLGSWFDRLPFRP
jgi:hypothetical protein